MPLADLASLTGKAMEKSSQDDRRWEQTPAGGIKPNGSEDKSSKGQAWKTIGRIQTGNSYIKLETGHPTKQAAGLNKRREDKQAAMAIYGSRRVNGI